MARGAGQLAQCYEKKQGCHAFFFKPRTQCDLAAAANRWWRVDISSAEVHKITGNGSITNMANFTAVTYKLDDIYLTWLHQSSSWVFQLPSVCSRTAHGTHTTYGSASSETCTIAHLFLSDAICVCWGGGPGVSAPKNTCPFSRTGSTSASAMLHQMISCFN